MKKKQYLSREEQKIFDTWETMTILENHIKNNTLPEFFEKYKKLLNRPTYATYTNFYPLDSIFGCFTANHRNSLLKKELLNLIPLFIQIINKYKLKIGSSHILKELLERNIQPQLFFEFLNTLKKYNDFPLNNTNLNTTFIDWYKTTNNPSQEILTFLEKIELQDKLKNNK